QSPRSAGPCGDDAELRNPVQPERWPAAGEIAEAARRAEETWLVSRRDPASWRVRRGCGSNVPARPGRYAGPRPHPKRQSPERSKRSSRLPLASFREGDPRAGGGRRGRPASIIGSAGTRFNLANAALSISWG